MPQHDTQGGKGWYRKTYIDGDFEKLGYPEFTFRGIDVNCLLYGELEKLLELRDRVSENDKEAGSFVGVLLEKLIESWNLTDNDTGEPLLPPNKDPESHKRLPMSFITHMIETVMGAVGGEPVPPASDSVP